jgi:hypothetical protein
MNLTAMGAHKEQKRSVMSPLVQLLLETFVKFSRFWAYFGQVLATKHFSCNMENVGKKFERYPEDLSGSSHMSDGSHKFGKVNLKGQRLQPCFQPQQCPLDGVHGARSLSCHLSLYAPRS